MIALIAGLALGGELHPDFPVLDPDGGDVLQTGRPWSPMRTCGGCHDTDYIAEHGTHSAGARVGSSDGPAEPGWDPDRYDVPPDLPSWARTYGLDHVGGGLVRELGVEMDCALCHLDEADDAARRAALSAGDFALANTATLTGTDLVSLVESDEGPRVVWNEAAFADGRFPAGRLDLRDPSAERCGSCHGTVHRTSEPLQTPDGRRSVRTGLVFSGQRIDRSALNLVDKDELARSWDVHAERLLECSSCHYSPNHPAYREEGATRPPHLRFDPRKTPLGSYLHRPSHDFVKGASASRGPTAANTMRRCEGCHDPMVGHDFLPDRGRHFSALACESCHVPRIAWTARQQLDWTALDAEGRPLEDWRGTDGTPDDPTSLHAGYEPILLPRTEIDGATRLAPFHLATTWLWTSEGAPVDRGTLAAVWSDPGLVGALDADGDGALSDVERRLDRADKVEAVRSRLTARGVAEPSIAGFVDAWPVNHGVTRGEHVIRECTVCHGEGSRLDREMVVAAWVPGGVEPQSRGAAASSSVVSRDGALVAAPPQRTRRYVFGADRRSWVDWGGVLALFGAVAFVIVHGGLRFVVAQNKGAQA